MGKARALTNINHADIVPSQIPTRRLPCQRSTGTDEDQIAEPDILL